MTTPHGPPDSGTASSPPPATPAGQVSLPRGLVRFTLGLCPYFALLIGGHALSLMLLNPFTGIGAVLTGLFWLGVAGFCLWVIVIGWLYLRRDDGITPVAARRIGIGGTLVLLAVFGLAVANLWALWG